MKEIISIHVGQAGVQIGNAVWELYCLEHQLNPDGTPTEAQNLSAEDTNSQSTNTSGSSSPLFSQGFTGKYVPRSVFVDLDPTVIDEVRKGTYKDLFHPDSLISGKEDCASNVFRGLYTVGRQHTDLALEKIRKIANDCDSLQGFMLYFSVEGGTGSGVSAGLLKKLSDEFNKTCKVAYVLYPSPSLSTSIMAPYNYMIAQEVVLNHTNITIALDNQSLYDICSWQMGIQRPSFVNINRLIARYASSLTAPYRFNGSLNSDFYELQMNLVPYPNTHFMTCSSAPTISAEKAHHEQISVSEMTNSVFDPCNFMVKCNPSHGMYMACCLMYQGDVVPKEAQSALSLIKSNRDIKFVDWSPTGFKVGIIDTSMVEVPGGDIAQSMRSVSLISNTSAIRECFKKNNRDYDMLYSKRSFYHHLCGEGADSGSIRYARDTGAAIIRDYEELDQNNIEEIEEDEE